VGKNSHSCQSFVVWDGIFLSYNLCHNMTICHKMCHENSIRNAKYGIRSTMLDTGKHRISIVDLENLYIRALLYEN
jgi:hypothetical protein